MKTFKIYTYFPEKLVGKGNYLKKYSVNRENKKNNKTYFFKGLGRKWLF